MPQQIAPFSVAVWQGRCPRCGRGKLFHGLLQIRDRCDVCGLDLRESDVGDGPAIFIILALTAILGASGSGKTTLLRVITGFEAADSGLVTLDGTVMDDGRRRVRPEHRRIGLVPQDGALFPHLTVRANVAFALPRRNRQGQRPDEMLDPNRSQEQHEA